MNLKVLPRLTYRDLKMLDLACHLDSKTMFCYGPSFDRLDQAGLLDDEPCPRPTPMARKLLKYLKRKGLYYGSN